VYAKSGRVSFAKFASVWCSASSPAKPSLIGSPWTPPCRALPVRNYVGRVIRDDVEIYLHATGMRGLDECTHVALIAEMRIDAREIRHPVTVITGGLLSRRTLHRLVLEDRRQPDSCRTEGLNVVKARTQAFEIAAVIERLGGWIEAGDQRPTFEPAAIVCRVRILETIRQEEVDDFVLRLALQETLCTRGVAAEHGQGQGAECEWVSAHRDGRIVSAIPVHSGRECAKGYATPVAYNL